MAGIFLTIKNIFHGVVAAFMLIPIMLTMGNSDDPNTPVETFPDYPVTYPEIEKKASGNLYEAEKAE